MNCTNQGTQPQGVFAQYQPEYAEHGIATFPVKITSDEKRPAIRGYMNIGRNGSAKLLKQFYDAEALGFALKSNRITVLDVDTKDERVLADAMGRHGRTPFVVRTGSGNYQAWYENNSEGRHVRPWQDRPIDVLGHGYVVAPPSKAVKCRYTIIQGSLDDLEHLPSLKNLELPQNDVTAPQRASNDRGEGKRNNTLFRACMKIARKCDTEHELESLAIQYAIEHFDVALPLAEIKVVVQSVWGYTTRCENYVGISRVVTTHDEIDTLARDHPDAFILLAVLRRYHWNRRFFIADAMAKHGTVPYNRKRLSKARKILETNSYVIKTRGATKGCPALFRWPEKSDWSKSSTNKIHTGSLSLSCAA